MSGVESKPCIRFDRSEPSLQRRSRPLYVSTHITENTTQTIVHNLTHSSSLEVFATPRARRCMVLLGTTALVECLNAKHTVQRSNANLAQALVTWTPRSPPQRQRPYALRSKVATYDSSPNNALVQSAEAVPPQERPR